MSRRTTFSAQTLAVLSALVAEPSAWRHGYDLARETGLKSGTLYPILVRLADREIVQASWEECEPAGRPRRHLYRLSSDGLAAATAALAAANTPAARPARPRRAGHGPAAGRRGFVMERLAAMLAGTLRAAAWLLPPGRRQWAEAARAEAGQVPAGWPRLSWLAGGLWLVAREAKMVRKVLYWVGVGVVATAAALAIWLSWRAVRAPYYDPQAVTDRVRVLAGVAALVTLPWVGRRRGWFGPVGSSITARLVRVAGCAAMCGLGMVVVRMDTHLLPGANVGPFSLPREIAGLTLFAAVLAAPAVEARWPQVETDSLWFLAALAGVAALAALPLQILTIAYVAAILIATSRRSPVATTSLAIGAVVGALAYLAIYELVTATGDIGQILFLIVAAMTFLLAIPAGIAGAWLLPETGDVKELREARIRQGLFAGAVAGAVCGVLLTFLSVVAVFMMLVGPVAGAVAGAAGGFFVAEHPPRRSRPDGSRAAGLFVLVSNRHTVRQATDQ